jgi:formamidopyrimidine-DNA glycosylase
MPELAEVEFFRKQWESGSGDTVTAVELNGRARVFRDCDIAQMQRLLPGARFISSEANGKKLLFRFASLEGGPRLWLGLHMGMTGKLTNAPPAYAPERHDHLVLFLEKQALVFTDSRQFGRVHFAHEPLAPSWWRHLPPAIVSAGFTLERVESFLKRCGRRPVKALLLMQEVFPGVGNWMADEILWRARIHPARAAGELTQSERHDLWREARLVCRGALRTIGEDFRDPPEGWLFHVRWQKGGRCPRSCESLVYETIAGRTTCWCPRCQAKR